MLDGYKSYIGAAIMAASAALSYLGYGDLAESAKVFGFALLGAGVAHKVDKNK